MSFFEEKYEVMGLFVCFVLYVYHLDLQAFFIDFCSVLLLRWMYCGFHPCCIFFEYHFTYCFLSIILPSPILTSYYGVIWLITFCWGAIFHSFFCCILSAECYFLTLSFDTFLFRSSFQFYSLIHVFLS